MASNVVASDTATTNHTSSSQHTTLQSVRRNAQYLLDPQHSPAPDRRRTRTLLRTARYLGVFLFWRLVRYAKYAAVGACLLYTSPSPRDGLLSRMPSSA